MRTFVVPENLCPHCQAPLNRCTDPNGLDSPSPGDVSICIRCAGLLQYGQSLELHKLEQIELDQIALEDPEGYQKIMQFRSIAQSAKRGDRNG